MRSRLPYHKLNASTPRETAFDLYTEFERLPWYYKAFSTFSAWLILAGFILFSIAYVSDDPDIWINPSYLGVLASAAVLLGYLAALVLALLSRSLIYIFDGVLMPVLTASAVGVFSTVIHRALKVDVSGTNSLYLWLPLAAALLGTIVAGTSSWTVYKKLRAIKELDNRRRIHVTAQPETSPMFPLYPLSSPSPSRSGFGKHLNLHSMVPDDEQQRRQLMQLLLAKEDANKRSMEDDAATNYYHISLPGEEDIANNRNRSGSLPPATKLGIGRLRASSTSTGGFKDPREVKREAIERRPLERDRLYATISNEGGSSTWHGSTSQALLHQVHHS